MTSVSIRTRPKIRMKRMCGAEPGLREMPSQAELMSLAWQKAPAAAARVMTMPPTMIDSLNREALVSVRPPPAPASWARRGPPTGSRAAPSSTSDFIALDMARILKGLMVFLMGDGAPDIDTGQEDENEGLDGSGEDGHGHEGQGREDGDEHGGDTDEGRLG